MCEQAHGPSVVKVKTITLKREVQISIIFCKGCPTNQTRTKDSFAAEIVIMVMLISVASQHAQKVLLPDLRFIP